MKNIEIISMNEQVLFENGIMEKDEQIHTYAGWKQLGFQAKRGEKAITQFPIWKMVTSKKTGDDVTFLKNSSWFKSSQVEVIQ